MTLLLEDGARDHVTEMAPATERTETSAVAGTGSGAVIAVLLATRLLRLQCCEAGRRWPAPAARRTARPATTREGGPPRPEEDLARLRAHARPTGRR